MEDDDFYESEGEGSGMEEEDEDSPFVDSLTTEQFERMNPNYVKFQKNSLTVNELEDGNVLVKTVYEKKFEKEKVENSVTYEPKEFFQRLEIFLTKARETGFPIAYYDILANAIVAMSEGTTEKEKITLNAGMKKFFHVLFFVYRDTSFYLQKLFMWGVLNINVDLQATRETFEPISLGDSKKLDGLSEKQMRDVEITYSEDFPVSPIDAVHSIEVKGRRIYLIRKKARDEKPRKKKKKKKIDEEIERFELSGYQMKVKKRNVLKKKKKKFYKKIELWKPLMSSGGMMGVGGRGGVKKSKRRSIGKEKKEGKKMIVLEFHTEFTYNLFSKWASYCGILETKKGAALSARNKIFSVLQGSIGNDSPGDGGVGLGRRRAGFSLAGSKLFDVMDLGDLKILMEPLWNEYVDELFAKTEVSMSDKLGQVHKILRKQRSIRKRCKNSSTSSSSSSDIIDGVFREIYLRNTSRDFFQKSFLLWTWIDIRTWCSNVIVFSELSFSHPRSLIDYVEDKIEENERNFSVDDVAAGKTLPIQKFVRDFEELCDCSSIFKHGGGNNDDDESISGEVFMDLFADEMEIFASNELKKRDLLKYLLSRKFVKHVENCEGAFEALKKISDEENEDEMKRLLGEYQVKLKDEGYVKNMLARRVFQEECSVLFENNGGKEKERGGGEEEEKSRPLRHVMKDVIKAIHLKTRAALRRSMLEFCEVDTLAKKLFKDFGGGGKVIDDSDSKVIDDGVLYGEGLVHLVAKLNFTSSVGELNLLKRMQYKVVQPLVSQDIPFAYFHCGVSLQNIKFDFVNDSHVRARQLLPKKNRSTTTTTSKSEVFASFQVGEFFLDVRDVMKLVEFLFRTNQEENYNILRNNCQTFALNMLRFMKSSFHCSDMRETKGILQGCPSDWIDDMKLRGKNDIVRRVKLTSRFTAAFPHVLKHYSKDKKKDGGGDEYVCFDEHKNLRRFMQRCFGTQQRYDLVKTKFPDMLELLKAFCRGFIFQEKSSRKFMEGCYFNRSGGSEGSNYLNIVL